VRVIFVLLVVVLVVLAVLLVMDLQRRRRLGRARWHAATHSLPEGGFVVQIECEGEHAQEVARIPGDIPSEDLGWRLAEAQSEAEARAHQLNATRRLERASR
jgi:hypothetical protein